MHGRTSIVAGAVQTGFLALVVSLVGGCGPNQANPVGPPGTGFFSVRMTDGPGPYDEVNIVFDSVSVHVSSGDTLAGWYTIFRGHARYNLLDFINGKDTVIVEGAIPTGTYNQLRVYLGAGSTVVTGGSTYILDVPSGMQSGLKFDIQASIRSDTKYEVALDFDADRSIMRTGGSHYTLKPVVKAVVTALSGRLTGQVVPDTVGATVLAIADTDTSATFADASGRFTFKYIDPGLYLIRCVPADARYRIKDLPNEEVVAGQTTDIGVAIFQLQ